MNIDHSDLINELLQDEHETTEWILAHEELSETETADNEERLKLLNATIMSFNELIIPLSSGE